jgi:hypothetical protein
MVWFTRKFKNICIKNNRLTRKIKKYKPDILKYSYWQKSIILKNNNDIDKYFSSYKIPDIFKNICKEWLLTGGGCFLDFSKIFCGTIYLTKTQKPSFYNHIHIFKILKNKIEWHNKKSKKNGKYYYSQGIKNIVNKFKKLLY